MSLKLVPFESLGAVSYSPSIVTVAVSVAVCEIFSVKEWCDLENRVRVRSRSLKMAPFDRSHTSSYSTSVVTMPSQDVCLSVRPSVCLSHAGILLKRLYTSSNVFHHHSILVFAQQTIWQYYDGDSPNGGVECKDA